jgi:AAA15 family ATPase/GTPase
MLKKIKINNFKSINEFSVELGRFNVFIGENGCGKSNILEALAFPSAAYNGNIENDFLALRGVRISDPKLYRNGFDGVSIDQPIKIALTDSDDNIVEWIFENDNLPFSKWKSSLHIDEKHQEKEINTLNLQVQKIIDEVGQKAFEKITKQGLGEIGDKNKEKLFRDLIDTYLKDKTFSFKGLEDSIAIEINKLTKISDYLIFAPENFFLRNFKTEEIFLTPVGYRGEGLLGLIKIIKKNKPDHYKEIISHLVLIDWFIKFDVEEMDALGEAEFHLMDKYLDEGIKYFDIRNTNEGFLFLLFFLTLFISDYTPTFFSIDNIDTALNPKLCSKLISLLSSLAVKYNKQVIVTTHNPSVLDGLNLNNDDERLFVISRNAIGHTKATRINKKPSIAGESSLKLSEQFLRGYIGGLPKNF